jgi:fatty acid desaturase
MSESNQFNQITSLIRELKKEYGKPIAWIYWLDFVISYSILIGGIILSIKLSGFLSVLFFIVSAIAGFRVSIFVHEINHSGKQIKGFEIAYNLLFGYLFKIPSYVFSDHKYHHNIKTFGSKSDPKYDDFSNQKLSNLFQIFPSSILQVVRLNFRFLFVPIFFPFLSIEKRKKVYSQQTSHSINPHYVRAEPRADQISTLYLHDLATCLYGWSILVLCTMQILPWSLVLILAGVLSAIWTLDFVHLLTAHRYDGFSKAGNLQAQADDSITIVGSWITEIWNPVGLRYHALHHLQEDLPYHSLGKIHQILVNKLPSDNFYQKSIERSAWPVWVKLFSRMS